MNSFLINLLHSNEQEGYVTGEANISFYASPPFNWFTLGLPTCGADLSISQSPTLYNVPCVACCNPDDVDSCCQRPGVANAFGCLHPNTCGTCHLPTGEKCASINSPDCTICAPDTPSCLNLCGFAMFDWPCAGEGRGTAGSCQSCGKCGIPTLSMACPCSQWGNCGVLPMKCQDGECELVDCCKDLTFNGCESFPDPFAPIFFEKAHIYFTRAVVKDMTGNPFAKEARLELEFGNFKWDSHAVGFKGIKGDFKALPSVGFMESSRNLELNNLKVKVYESGGFSNTVIGEGEISMYALLQAGYHNEITLNLALGKNDVSGVRRPTLQVSVSMLIKSEKMVPKQSRNTGVRASVAGRHAKQAGFFYESKPENIQKTLTKDMFEAKPSENMSSEDAMKIMASSIDDDDVLVGYQVELISKTSGQSKGLWCVS